MQLLGLFGDLLQGVDASKPDVKLVVAGLSELDAWEDRSWCSPTTAADHLINIGCGDYSLLRAAVLPNVNLYSLRRAIASIVHALGVPPKVIVSRMGHADTQVLFKHYIREFKAQDLPAAESMAAAIRKARPVEHPHAEGDA